ncbi:hypothetical protein GCM10018954_098130 [Kutzneria kofuensis]
MNAMKKIAVGLAASALTLTAAVVGAPAASATGDHFILFSNKSVVFKICFRSWDASGRDIKQKCTTWPAGAAGGKYVYRVPANATQTRFTASDRGQQMKGVTLDNNQNYCFRAPASGNGRVDGPITPCNDN